MKYYVVWWDYEINTEIRNPKSKMDEHRDFPASKALIMGWLIPTWRAYPTSKCHCRNCTATAAWARMKVHFPKRSPMSFLWADGHMESMDRPTADTARQRCECWGAVLLHGTGQQLEYLNNLSLKETVTEVSSVSVRICRMQNHHGDSRSTKPTPMAIPAPASKPQRERVGFNMRQPSWEDITDIISTYIYIHIYTHVYIYLLISLFIFLCIYLFIYLFIYLYLLSCLVLM